MSQVPSDTSQANQYLNPTIVKPTNWTVIGGNLFSGGFQSTSTPVVCKDGTKKMQPSSPNAKYEDVCRYNGGVDNEKARQEAQKQYEETLKKQYEEALKQQPQKPRTFIEMNQGYIIIGLVLVAGYFAYKKYKK